MRVTGAPSSQIYVRSASPGRLRAAVTGLRRNRAMQARLQDALATAPEIMRFSLCHRTGNVLVETELDEEAVRAALETAVVTCQRELGGEPVRLGRRERLRRVLSVADGPALLRHGTRVTLVLQDRAGRASAALGDTLQRVPGWPADRRDRDRERRAKGQGVPRRRHLESVKDPAPTGQDEPSRPWHVRPADEVLESLRSDRVRGLTVEESEARLLCYGQNALAKPEVRSSLEIFIEQFRNAPVLMLSLAAGASLVTGGAADAAMIGVVIVLNGTVGFFTERGAERAIATLTESSAQKATVIREGAKVDVDLEHVVPGDVLVLQSGIAVSADARILQARALMVDESSLTGESKPVAKQAASLAEAKLPLGDRSNMIYRGTVVTAGTGLALVVATGTATEIGTIQRMLHVVKPPETTMQKQLRTLGGYTVVVSSIACGAVFLLGLARGYSVLQMFKTGVSLAVAAVPEGLPTVAITTLALGLSRMQEQNVLVRHLDAVETLGSLQVVCFDKTGTITLNSMSARALYVGDRDLTVEAGRMWHEDREFDPRATPELTSFLEMVVLCSEVAIEQADGAAAVLHGSPTETALVQLALDAGVDAAALRRARPLHTTNYRSEERSIMSTLHSCEDGELLAVKGRPAEVLERCSTIMEAGQVRALSAEDRKAIERANESMAGRALRVLGVAYRRCGDGQGTPKESELVWLGLVGMADPPRSGMKALMHAFHGAGVRTVMITGDQGATAFAIGKDIQLVEGDTFDILDSTQLDELQPSVLQALAQRVDVFARVSPAHKLQIVQALQGSGQVVAMTGDGVNDAPALKAANIGVAMGAGGTSVAREVADIVLEDDNPATMVEAIRQGRTIYDDIRKSVHFILSTNMSEIMATLAMVGLGFGEGLSPMQLLWINLVTDIFPELALAVQPPDADVMARPPRDPEQPMFSRDEYLHMAREGFTLTAGALAACVYGARRYGPTSTQACTMTFLTLVSGQLLHTLSARSSEHSIFDSHRLPYNRFIPMAMGGGAVLTAMTQLVPPLRRLLGSGPIAARDWGVVALGAGLPFVVNEWFKLYQKQNQIQLRLDAGEG